MDKQPDVVEVRIYDPNKQTYRTITRPAPTSGALALPPPAPPTGPLKLFARGQPVPRVSAVNGEPLE